MIQNHRSIDNLDPIHQAQHRILFNACLGIIDKTLTTVPTLTQIPVGYFAKYVSGSTRRIYFNFDGVLTYITLTNA